MPDLARLRQAVNASRDAIFMTDLDGVFTFVNSQFESLYGYAAAEVLGRETPRILKAPSVPSEQYAELWQRLLDGESVQTTFLNLTKDGELVDVEANLSPSRDEAGAIVGFLAVQRDVTAHRQAEYALRQERDRAQQYLDVADIMLVALDMDGRATMINRKGCALVEREEHEIVGHDWIETCIPARFRSALAQKLRNLQAGDLSPVENPILTKSGRERIISWRNTVIRDASGRITGTLSSGEDLTERRKAELALGESQAQLQLISDNVLDLVSQIRLDGTFVYVSPSYRTVLGYEPQALVGTSAFDLVHPDDVSHLRDVLAQSIAARTTGRAEFRSRRADGSYVWLETVGKLILDTSRQPDGAILSTRDISELKRREDVQRDYDRRLRLAVASTNMALFTQDAELRYTWAHNPQFGIGADYALGKTDVDLLPPGIAEQVTDIKRHALRTGERMHREISGMAEGRARWFELTIEPLRTASGKVEGLTGAAIDITERRQLEDQLRQAQKLEAIGSLAGGIAHDFNNLLTAITGYAELVLHQLPADAAVRRDVEEILRAGQSAEALTRQLLIFSRKSVVQPVLLRLNDIVSRMDKILRRMVGEHIAFDVRLGPDLGFVRADAGQIEQVLMNLVVNARDAMPMGGTVRIETGSGPGRVRLAPGEAGANAGMFEWLAVTDTGTGMSREVQSQIFEPFFTTKGPEKGTGLGLATVHGIARQAGGYIDVQSAPGEGSTFTVYLPRSGDERHAEDRGVQKAAVGGTEKILLVEDDDSVRTMTLRALRRYGYRVIAAADAEEALRRAAELRGEIDLLITDVVMPGLNGRALAERLGVMRPGMKIVYTSGFTEDSELLQGVRTGETPFVQKPYAIDALARTIRRVLEDD